MPILSNRVTRSVAAAVTTAFVLAGCAQAPADVQPAPENTPSATASPSAPAVAPPSAMEPPTLDYSTVTMTPAVDGGVAPTGSVAVAKAAKVGVYDAAGGTLLGLLPATEPVPVVEHAPGWVRVLVPSRRVLPSQARATGGVIVPDGNLRDFINRGTGWVLESDVTITTGLPRVFVNKADQRVEVIRADGRALAVYSANIGAGVPEGPTFVASGTGHSAGCGDAVPIKLSAQSETEDGYRGQAVSPLFIAGPSLSCNYSAKDVADMTPRMIQLSPADATQLATLVQPGVQVDIVSGAPSGAVAS